MHELLIHLERYASQKKIAENEGKEFSCRLIFLSVKINIQFLIFNKNCLSIDKYQILNYKKINLGRAGERES